MVIFKELSVDKMNSYASSYIEYVLEDIDFMIEHNPSMK